MPIASKDEQYLRRALGLARQGIGLASPNPNVGAVIIGGDASIVAEATHTYAARKHAEIIALEIAGEKARGGTLYMNLEPCCHQGRTGPCADAIISAGLKRVVAAMTDPNPQVAGKGFAQLRAAGVQVDIADGALHADARRLNEAFAKYIQQGTPLVTLKAGMTLDGKIAPPPNTSATPTALGSGGSSGGWITSDEARAHVQQLRHASDAIMVGVGTIIADDPLLTDRTGLPRRRPLMRLILDSRLRMPIESRVVKTANKDVMVFCAFAEAKRKRELEARGIVVEQLPLHAGTEAHVVGGRPIRAADGRPDLRALLERLGASEITSVLIEGGALVNWISLASGIVDKMFLYYAPKILAGSGAVPFASGEGFQHLSEAAHVKSITLHRFGEDFAVEGYLQDPYEVVQRNASPQNVAVISDRK